MGGLNVGTKILHNNFDDFSLAVMYKHRNADSIGTGAEVAYNYVTNCVDAFHGNPWYVNFHDNLCVDCGFYFGNNGGREQGTNCLINHNTVYGAGLFFDNPSEGPVTNCVLTNNIFRSMVALSPYSYGTLTPHNTTLDYNCYITGDAAFGEYSISYSLTDWITHYGGDAHSIAGTPTYVGGANPTTITGYALAGGSIGKNAGSDGLDLGALIDSVGIKGSGPAPIDTPVITTLKHPMGRVAYVDTCLGTGFGASGGTATLGGTAVTISKQTDDTLIWVVPTHARGTGLLWIYSNAYSLSDTVAFIVLVPTLTVINP